jgi:hypothetical protein
MSNNELDTNSKSNARRYEERLYTLNRKALHLKDRIANYQGKNPSYDKREYAAIVWAIEVIESNQHSAISLIHSNRKGV